MNYVFLCFDWNECSWTWFELACTCLEFCCLKNMELAIVSDVMYMWYGCMSYHGT